MTHHTLMYCSISFSLQSYLVMPYHAMSRFALQCHTILYFTTLHYSYVCSIHRQIQLFYVTLSCDFIGQSINQTLRHLGFYYHVTLTLFSPPSPFPFLPSFFLTVSPFLPSSIPSILYILYLTHSTQHSTTQDFILPHYTALHFSSPRHNQCSSLPFFCSTTFNDFLIEFYYIKLTFVGGRPDWPGPCPGRIGPIVAMLLR